MVSAEALNLHESEAAAAYERLHAGHFLFLDPGTHHIRMAWPFSGVNTPFNVHVGQLIYQANCAWDMLGIPAVLQTDAIIHASFEDSQEQTVITITAGQLHHMGGVVHFPLPLSQWYDDLILT